MTRRYGLEELERAVPGLSGVRADTNSSTGSFLAGRAALAFDGIALPDVNAAMAAGLNRGPFAELRRDRQNDILRRIVATPAIAARADAPRLDWFPILLALAHAEHLGATDARAIALAWCMTSSRFLNEVDFDRDWNSFDPDRPNGITVGTLIQAAGVDITAWSDQNSTPTQNIVAANFFQPARISARHLSRPPWVIPGLAMAGAVTLLVSLGGSGKTAVALNLAVAMAAQRRSWGPFVIRGTESRLHRVAYMSAEEIESRLCLVAAAQAQVLALDASERASVELHLFLHDAAASGWRLDISDGGNCRVNELIRHLKDCNITLLVVDTAAALILLANENDNAAVTAAMNLLHRIAREAECAVLLLHHVPKQSRDSAAGQRSEQTLVRGGGAWSNSARVVVSLTNLSGPENKLAEANGHEAAALRWLTSVKINDAVPFAPVPIKLVSEEVQIADGSQHSTRAIQFTRLTTSSATTGTSGATTRRAIMEAISAGVLEHGVRVPLSAGPGQRAAFKAAAEKLGILNERQARDTTNRIVGDLMARGWVAEVDVMIPKRKPNGAPDGQRRARGLELTEAGTAELGQYEPALGAHA